MAALNDGTPALGRTSIGTMEDERNVFNQGNTAPFRMTTLAPDVFTPAPANIQFTRTSITGVADGGDDDSDDLKDPEKGEVRMLRHPGVVTAIAPSAPSWLARFPQFIRWSAHGLPDAALHRGVPCMPGLRACMHAMRAI